MRKQFYLDLETGLNNIKDEQDKSIIKTIDLWNNQWDNLESISAFAWPAVFIEFVNFPWKTIGRKIQQAEAIISLHIGSYSLAQSKKGSSNQDKALQHLDTIDIIHFWMGRLRGVNFGTFTRIDSRHDHNHGAVLAHQEIYKVLIKDAGASPEMVKTSGNKLIVKI